LAEIDPAFAAKHPDAAELFHGRPPSSYRAVGDALAELLRLYGDASRTDAETASAEAKAIKATIFRIGAHCNPFVSGEVTSDISVDEWFGVLHTAARRQMESLTADLHATAVQRGEARELSLPKHPAGDAAVALAAAKAASPVSKAAVDAAEAKLKAAEPKQDAYVPYLGKRFEKQLNKLLAKPEYQKVDPNELKIAAMLVQADYLDRQLREREQLDRLGGQFLAPLNKDWRRALIKVREDCVDEAIPPAHLQDVVRRSLETETLEEQELFVERLVALGGAVRRFELVRSKSYMPQEDAEVKFTMVNCAYTPVLPGGGEKPVTFKEMVEAGGGAVLRELAQARQARDGGGLSDLLVEAALELLASPALAKARVTMIIELQLYGSVYLRLKKRTHAVYKVDRAASARALVQDLASHATNPAMVYRPPVGVTNEVCTSLKENRSKVRSELAGLVGTGVKLASANATRVS